MSEKRGLGIIPMPKTQNEKTILFSVVLLLLIMGTSVETTSNSISSVCPVSLVDMVYTTPTSARLTGSRIMIDRSSVFTCVRTSVAIIVLVCVSRDSW